MRKKIEVINFWMTACCRKSTSWALEGVKPPAGIPFAVVSDHGRTPSAHASIGGLVEEAVVQSVGIPFSGLTDPWRALLPVIPHRVAATLHSTIFTELIRRKRRWPEKKFIQSTQLKCGKSSGRNKEIYTMRWGTAACY